MDTMPTLAAHSLNGTLYSDTRLIAESAGILLSLHGKPTYGLIVVDLPLVAAKRLAGLPLTFYATRGVILDVVVVDAMRSHGGVNLAFRCEGTAGMGVGALAGARLEPIGG